MTTEPFFRRLEKIDAVIAAGPKVCNFLQDLAPYLSEEASRTYFYDALKDPAWLIVLMRADVFRNPPEPQKDQTSGNLSFPLWPESRYLARMAALAPETVLEIILRLPDTNNIRIHNDLIDAALTMPPALSSAVIPKVKAWIESPYRILLPDKLGMLIAHLAQGEQVNAALELAHSLLIILPRSGARFDIWYYEEILQKHIPSLVTASGLTALQLLCTLLDNAMGLESEHSEIRENSSYIWRPAIEEHQQNTPQGFRGLPDLLVSAVRDAAEQIMRNQKVSVKDVVFQLQNYKESIYHRLLLYLLSIFPTSAPELVAEQLTNHRNFENVELRHEYTLLARSGFAQLSLIDQVKILGWIEEGPKDIDAYKLSYERQTGQQPSNGLITAYVKHWRRDWLARLGPDLPSEWKHQYEKLVAEYGPPEHPEFMLYRTVATFIDSTSTLSIDKLNSMSVKDIISYFKMWQPSQDFIGPSPQGLSRTLTAAVEIDAGRFATEAKQFRKLDPIYVSGLLAGFEHAAKQKMSFLWKPVLDLCSWVSNQSREISKRNDTDRVWTESLKTIAQLLSNGFESSTEEIPFALRDKAWKVLRILSNDPNPTSEEESSYSNNDMDPATLALNSVRGEAMHAVIRYALWVRRHLKEENNEKEQVSQGLNAMPEVRKVLNKHLNPDYDTSLAIRSVYGQWLPWLVLLDRHWVIRNMTRIFPKEEPLRKLRNAAWESYIIFCAPFDNVFDILQAEYSYVVERIGTASSERRYPFTPGERLAEHLMILYWRGKLDLGGPKEILSQFFAKAPVTLRAHALKFVGLSLYNTKDIVPLHTLDRLQELWRHRLDVARSAKSHNTYVSELAAFGWWFGSSKFDATWAITQLRAVLTLNNGTIEAQHLVMENLAGYASTMPLMTVECLNLLIKGNEEGINTPNWQEQARIMLIAAYTSTDDTARIIANNLVNRLGARGYYEAFRDLAFKT